jgi:hypothetical protein
MVSLGASVVVLGGLLAGSIGIQRSLHNSEVYTAHYASSRRLIDCVARDLRRSVAITVVTAGGSSAAANGQTVTFSDDTSIVFTLPGYYRSNEPTDSGYDQPLSVVNTDGGPAYGSGSTPAASVLVNFRKFHVAQESSICFVREEDGARQTLVRNAKNLNITLRFSPDGRSCTVEAWFKSPLSGYKRDIATCDRVMLRNGLPPL